MNRRRFLSWLSLTVVSAASAFAAVPMVGFILAPVFRRRNGVWRRVGTVDSFAKGQTVLVSFVDANARSWAGPVAKSGAWLRRETDEQFTAFSLDCTHLGCPLRWEAGAELFLCPCHGGVFYKNGKVAGGPPPRPMVRYPVRVQQGQVEIQTEPLPIT